MHVTVTCYNDQPGAHHGRPRPPSAKSGGLHCDNHYGPRAAAAAAARMSVTAQ